MKLYYRDSLDYLNNDPCYLEASEQTICEAAAEILKRRTGKKAFGIELGKEKK